MKSRLRRIAALSLLAAALLPAAAHAQLGDLLDKARGAGGAGALGGALSGQSMSSGSTGNVAGILEFCIRNNYLSGNAASSRTAATATAQKAS